MKYLKQFGIILLISFAGEALNYLPLPVPASIYGLVLMFCACASSVWDVRDTRLFHRDHYR